VKVNLKELARFLVKAKSQTYAGDAKEVSPQRPDFSELEFSESDLNYRDSYFGFFMAPGQEVVRLDGKTIWVMSYSGGMRPEHCNDVEFAEKTFAFLKKALSMVEETKPFRGPKNLKENEWEYKCNVEGDITDFNGTEYIYFEGDLVFRQNFIGGMAIYKESPEYS